jgi:hypothetical protein
VQGRLRQEKLTFDISTECAQSGRSLHILMDGEMNYQVTEEDAHPLIFEPHLDWANFSEPHIIDAY